MLALGQAPPPEVIPAGQAIDQALRTSSLTYEGKPFHALLEIDEEKHPDGIYKSSVEVFWAAPNKYRLQVTSRDFSQTLIVNGTHTQETDAGDFYPGWLRQFVMALMDPAPRAQDPLLRSGTVTMQGGQFMGRIVPPHGCADHENRPNGITNELTSGEICFEGAERRLTNVQQFDYGMGFAECVPFGKKQIATAYTVMVSTFPSDEYISFIKGRLKKLEPLNKTTASLFAIHTETNPSGSILTTFVSTADAEALLEESPEMNWPPVAHGKTDGYLLLHIITDKAGNVRSAWRKSADNSWLEPYAMTQALKFKFKPLMVDGVAHQMEAPFVLHFKTVIDDSMPKFGGDMIAQVAEGCQDSTLPAGLMPPGTAFSALVFVNEAGKLAGIDYPETVPIEIQRAANKGYTPAGSGNSRPTVCRCTTTSNLRSKLPEPSYFFTTSSTTPCRGTVVFQSSAIVPRSFPAHTSRAFTDFGNPSSFKCRRIPRISLAVSPKLKIATAIAPSFSGFAQISTGPSAYTRSPCLPSAS
jgi:hypothetical protein